VADTRRDEPDNDQTSGLSQWLHTETTAPANNRRKPPKAIQKLHRQMKKPVYNDESTEGTEMTNFEENDASTRSDSTKTDISKWLRSARGVGGSNLSGVQEEGSEADSDRTRSRSMTQPDRHRGNRKMSNNRSNKSSMYDDESSLDATMSNSRAPSSAIDFRDDDNSPSSVDFTVSDSRAPSAARMVKHRRGSPTNQSRSKSSNIYDDSADVGSEMDSDRTRSTRTKTRAQPRSNAVTKQSQNGSVISAYDDDDESTLDGTMPRSRALTMRGSAARQSRRKSDDDSESIISASTASKSRKRRPKSRSPSQDDSVTRV